MADLELDRESLVRRNARLEEEIAVLKSEAETATINHEQSSRAMEERFEALSEEQGRLAGLKEQLQTDKQRLTNELTETRGQVHSLQAQLVQKDAKVEESAVLAEALHSEKRALDKHLEHCQQEIADSERRLKAAQDNVVALAGQNTKLDAEAQEAKAGQRRTELEKVQLRLQYENLERNNKWLEENMGHLNEALKTERQKAAQQVMGLESSLQQAEARVQSLEKTESHLRSQLEQREKAAEEAQHQLKVERNDASDKEQQFEKELAIAQKLATLYKSNCEKRTAEAAQMESVVRDLRRHVEDLTAAHLAATKKLEEARAEAETRLKEEKQKCQRMLEAAATGHFPSNTATADPATPTPAAGPGDVASPTSAAIARLSKTEIYVKYAEATSSWKEERLKNRQNEIILDQLCTEMERKAVSVKEQEAEYHRVQAAYNQMNAALEMSRHEKRHSEARALDLEAQIRRDAKERESLRQQLQDLGHQVAVLLNEQQRLQHGHHSRTSATANGNGSSNGVLTAGDAITQHLLSFSDIQELQEQNQKQLAVIRELSAKLENASAQMREELEAEKQRLKERVDADIAENKRHRLEQQDLVQQIARQRDMFRKLLKDASADPSRAAGNMQLIASADAQAASTSPLQPSKEPDYKQLLEDMEKEVEKVRADAADHARALREEASLAKEAAVAARAEASRFSADLAFEKARADNNDSYMREQAVQLQQAAEHSSKYQGMMIGLQERLSTSMAEMQGAQQTVAALKQKVHQLEMQKTLATQAEQRLNSELSQLSSEKHTREAELKAERAKLAKLEEDYSADRIRLTSELAKAQQGEAEAVKELRDAQKRARDAVAARDVIQERADDRVGKVEAELGKLRAAESEALQKAAAAQGKVDVLQKALQKAEERAANLEFQVNSRAGGQASSQEVSDLGESREAQLASELKLCKEELMAAYEKAAEATSHVAQYQALAESSDQALTAMQNDHAAYKEEADKRIKAANEAAEQLREQIQAAKQDSTELQRKLHALEESSKAVAQEKARVEAKLTAEIRDKQATIRSRDENMARQRKDLDFWRQKFNSAEERAQREVIDHAGTIKQLQAADAIKSRLEASVQENIQAKAVAEAKQSSAEHAFLSKTAEQEAAVAAAVRRKDEMEQQNKLLHQQLEKLASQVPTGGEGNELAGVVSFLRQQNEVVEEEKQLARYEAERLRSEMAVLKRTIDALRSQLASEDQRHERAQKEEALFQERKEHQLALNVVKESNASLRRQNTEMDKQTRSLQAQVERLQAQIRPQELEATRLRADIENLQDEVKLKAQEAERWEKRVEQLQAKYGKVDLVEYQRVETQLSDLQKSLKDSVPRADLDKALARIQEVETIARGKVAQDFHRRTVERLDGLLRTANSDKAQASAEVRRLAEELQAVTKRAEEAAKTAEEAYKALDQKLKRVYKFYNPQSKKGSQWREEQERLVQQSEQGKALLAAIKGFLPEGSDSAALAAKLQADASRIADLESQLQTAGKAGPEVAALRAQLSECQKHGTELQQQLTQLKQTHDASVQKLANGQARERELTAKIYSLEETIKRLKAAGPTPQVAERAAEAQIGEPLAGGSAAGDATPAVPVAQTPVDTIMEEEPVGEPQDTPKEHEAPAVEEAPAAEGASAEPAAETGAQPTPTPTPTASLQLPQEATAEPIAEPTPEPTQPNPTPKDAPHLQDPLAAAAAILQPSESSGQGATVGQSEAAAISLPTAKTVPETSQAPAATPAPAAATAAEPSAAEKVPETGGAPASSKVTEAPAEPRKSPPKPITWPTQEKPAQPSAPVAGNLNPGAASFTPPPSGGSSGGDFMSRMREQALQNLSRPREATTSTPPATKGGTWETPVPKSAAVLAGEAAAKRARAPPAISLPPAKKAKSGAEGDGPEVSLDAAAGLEAAGAPADDAADTAQQVPEGEGQGEEDDFGEDRWGMGDEGGDDGENEDEADNDSDQDMPDEAMAAASPKRTGAEASQPQAEPQKEDAQKGGTEGAEQEGGAKEGQEAGGREGGQPQEQEEGQTQRRSSRKRTPVVWQGSAAKKPEATADPAKEKSPTPQAPPSRGGLVGRVRGRGRGLGRGKKPTPE